MAKNIKVLFFFLAFLLLKFNFLHAEASYLDKEYERDDQVVLVETTEEVEYEFAPFAYRLNLISPAASFFINTSQGDKGFAQNLVNSSNPVLTYGVQFSFEYTLFKVMGIGLDLSYSKKGGLTLPMNTEDIASKLANTTLADVAREDIEYSFDRYDLQYFDIGGVLRFYPGKDRQFFLDVGAGSGILVTSALSHVVKGKNKVEVIKSDININATGEENELGKVSLRAPIYASFGLGYEWEMGLFLRAGGAIGVEKIMSTAEDDKVIPVRAGWEIGYNFSAFFDA